MPAGSLATVPPPVPDFVTVSVWNESNVPVIETFWVTVKVQVPVPEHSPPDHPENVADVVAVKVTLVP